MLFCGAVAAVWIQHRRGCGGNGRPRSGFPPGMDAAAPKGGAPSKKRKNPGKNQREHRKRQKLAAEAPCIFSVCGRCSSEPSVPCWSVSLVSRLERNPQAKNTLQDGRPLTGTLPELHRLLLLDLQAAWPQYRRSECGLGPGARSSRHRERGSTEELNIIFDDYKKAHAWHCHHAPPQLPYAIVPKQFYTLPGIDRSSRFTTAATTTAELMQMVQARTWSSCSGHEVDLGALRQIPAHGMKTRPLLPGLVECRGEASSRVRQEMAGIVCRVHEMLERWERTVPGCPFGRKDPPSRLVCAFTELRAVDSRHPAEAEAGGLWTRPPSMVAARETRALLRGSERPRPCVRTVQPKEERTRRPQPKRLYQFVTPESTHLSVYRWNRTMPSFARATSSCCSVDYSSKRRERFTRAPSAIRATSRELISSDDIAELIGCRALRPVGATGLGHELHH